MNNKLGTVSVGRRKGTLSTTVTRPLNQKPRLTDDVRDSASAFASRVPQTGVAPRVCRRTLVEHVLSNDDAGAAVAVADDAVAILADLAIAVHADDAPAVDARR